MPCEIHLVWPGPRTFHRRGGHFFDFCPTDPTARIGRKTALESGNCCANSWSATQLFRERSSQADSPLGAEISFVRQEVADRGRSYPRGVSDQRSRQGLGPVAPHARAEFP